MTLPMLIALLLLLILGSAFLSASETALFSLSSMKVRAYREGKEARLKLIATLLSQPRKLLVTILMLNVGINILVQNVVSGIFGTFSSWWLTVGVPLGLTLIFGEVLPKSIAYLKNSAIAYHTAPIIRIVEMIVRPLRDGITAVTAMISKCFFFYLRKEKEIEIEELKHALRSSQETGAVSREEARLLRGYLNLEEDVVKELMSPRSDMLFFDINQPLSELISLFVDEECTRIPVCNGSVENMLGIMVSGSFFLHRDLFHSSQQIVPFLRKPHFVPESMNGRSLLDHFYKIKESMAIVVDEYGSVSGLITVEDLVETVIGQIADSRDEKSYYTKPSPNVLIASGKLELIEFEEIFDTHLESPNNMATLGGWLTEVIGDIPKSGTRIEKEGFLFHVLASDINRVRRIYIRRLKTRKQRHE